jgi:nitrate reductase gamma subunit
MDEFLKILEDEVQIAALSIMAVVYILKVIWLMKFKPIVERTVAKGSKSAGIKYSFATIAFPWTMESSSNKPFKYIEFVIFHLGVLTGIVASFIIPYWPEVMENQAIVRIFQAFTGAAFLVGIIRIILRISVITLRIISSPDDYFSLFLLTIWLFAAFFAMPNDNYWILVAFFGLTAFFLIYVPFSKISHYLLWPFARYYLGKSLGHRGVYPKVTSSDKITFGQTVN